MELGPDFKPLDSSGDRVSLAADDPPPAIRRSPYPADYETFRNVVLALWSQGRSEESGGWSLAGIAPFFDTAPRELLPFVYELVEEGLIEWQVHPRTAIESRAVHYIATEWIDSIHEIFPVVDHEFSDDSYKMVLAHMANETFDDGFQTALGYHESDCPPAWIWFRYRNERTPRPTRLDHGKFLPIIEARDIEAILNQIARTEFRRWAGVTAADLTELLGLPEQYASEIEAILEKMVSQPRWEIEVSRDLSQTRYRTRGARTANQGGPAGAYQAITRATTRQESSSPSELARHLGIESSTVLNYLAKLEAAGLVTKHGPGDYRRTHHDPSTAILTIMAMQRGAGSKAEDVVHELANLQEWPDLKKLGRVALYAFIDELDGHYITINRTETTSGASVTPRDGLALLPRAWWTLQRCSTCAHPWGPARLLLRQEDNTTSGGKWSPPTHVQCPTTSPLMAPFNPMPHPFRDNDLERETRCRICATSLREKQDSSSVTRHDMEAAGAWPAREFYAAEGRIVRRLTDLARAAYVLDPSDLKCRGLADAIRTAFEANVLPCTRAQSLREIGQFVDHADLTDEHQASQWVNLIHDAAVLLDANRATVYLGGFHHGEPYGPLELRNHRSAELLDRARMVRLRRGSRIEVVHRNGTFAHPACGEKERLHR